MRKLYNFCGWLIDWFLFFLVLYLCFLVIYNLFLSLRRFFRRHNKPSQWPGEFLDYLVERWLSTWLGRRLRALRRRWQQRWPVYVRQWEYFLFNYELFLDSYKFSYRFRVTKPVLERFLGQLGGALLTFMGKHYRYICASAGHFIRRPITYKWTQFRLLKHFLGWTLGIAFYYYIFLWLAYGVYMLLDLVFLLLDLSFIYLIIPCFFNERHSRDPERVRFYEGDVELSRQLADPLVLLAEQFYEATFGRLKFFILVVLFEHLPGRVKALKDYYISKEFFFGVFLFGIIRYIVLKLARIFYLITYFLLITARYQTEFFFYRGRRRLREFRYMHLPRAVGIVKAIILHLIRRRHILLRTLRQMGSIFIYLSARYLTPRVALWRFRCSLRFLVFKFLLAIALRRRWVFLRYRCKLIFWWFAEHCWRIFVLLVFINGALLVIKFWGFIFFFKLFFKLLFFSLFLLVFFYHVRYFFLRFASDGRIQRFFNHLKPGLSWAKKKKNL